MAARRSATSFWNIRTMSATWGGVLQVLQGCDSPAVDFDRNNACRALEQQCARQSAGTGSDLDHRSLAKRRGGAGNAPSEVEVKREMLAQALARVEAMGGDGLAQRRQPGERVHVRSGVQVWRRRA